MILFDCHRRNFFLALLRHLEETAWARAVHVYVCVDEGICLWVLAVPSCLHV